MQLLDYLARLLSANRPVAQRPHGLTNKVVISLTSYPARFQSLCLTLLSLSAQTVKPDIIVIWVSNDDKDDFLAYEPLKQLIDKFKINVGYVPNWRSYKKLIPALLKFPDAYVVTADDDLYYWPTWLEELTSEVVASPNDVVAHRIHRVVFDACQDPLPYLVWPKVITDKQASLANFPTTGGGVIFPPRCFNEGVRDIDLALELCPHSDDIWFYFWLLLSRKLVRATGSPNKEVGWPIAQSSSLWSTNSKGGNDTALLRMLQRFGQVWSNDPVSSMHAGFSEAVYWDARYRKGGNSGAGSRGVLAEYKAEVINALVSKHAIHDVVELGCGDGYQLGLYSFPSYTGTDVSDKSIEICREKFRAQPNYRFLASDEFQAQRPRADLSMSIDVLFHLVNDDIFDAYMRSLFDASNRFVLLYAPNDDRPSQDRHIKFRCFTQWVELNYPDFALVEFIKNAYPYAPGLDPTQTSYCDFFLFETKPISEARVPNLGAAVIASSDPLVSIVIPVYNGSDYLEYAINSALRQDYKRIEIVVVNDGSNDDNATRLICDRYAEKIRYFEKANGGAGSALNMGLKHMQGDYFSWLSHDDIYRADKVSSQVRFVAGDTKIIPFNVGLRLDTRHRRLVKATAPDEFLAHPLMAIFATLVNGISTLVHSQWFATNIFNERLLTVQDNDMWLRLFKQGAVFKYQREDASIINRLHPAQSSNRLRQTHVSEKLDFYRYGRDFVQAQHPELATTFEAVLRFKGVNL